MPSAEMNSTLPAPMRKASAVMPKIPKIARPNRYSRTLAISAAMATFQASCLRSLLEWPRVRLMKHDSTKNGL
ncbi:hypothetical protein D3C79_599960 [compost metagenome]